MMAFTMRIEQAISDIRPATPRSSKVKSTASTRASNGRAQRQALRQEPLGRYCRGKAQPIHSVSCRDPDRLNAKLFKKRLGGMQSDPCAGRLAMISEAERKKMLRAHSIGPKMIAYLQEIGIERLSDLAGANPEEIAFRIDIALGRKHMNRLGVEALRNLIALADSKRA
jgi:hypothetical protein